MKSLVIAIKMFLLFSILTGIIYPLIITGTAQLVFNRKANGSLIEKGGTIAGRALIGQKFDTAIYFSSRPSATSYNPLPSGGSNFGLTNSRLRELSEQRRHQFIAFNNLDTLTSVPSEMLFASASGLDPHISLRSALLQYERISRVRRLNESQKAKLKELIYSLTEKKQLFCLGEPRINVLQLNLSLDNLTENK